MFSHYILIHSRQDLVLVSFLVGLVLGLVFFFLPVSTLSSLSAQARQIFQPSCKNERWESFEFSFYEVVHSNTADRVCHTRWRKNNQLIFEGRKANQNSGSEAVEVPSFFQSSSSLLGYFQNNTKCTQRVKFYDMQRLYLHYC